MKNLLVFVIALFFAQSAISQSCWVDGNPDPDMDAMQLEADFRGALITSEDALKKHHSIVVEHLSAYLPQRELHHFISSLTFSENGLTGYRFDVLSRNRLSYGDAYSLLSIFGAQSTAGVIPDLRINDAFDINVSSCDGNGWHGYRCQQPGTCATSASKICTHNC